MHLVLIVSVMRWPMELFEITPIGRVLNRFSKDIDTVDNVLPRILRAWLLMSIMVNNLSSLSSF